jgi:hypothetical protein
MPVNRAAFDNQERIVMEQSVRAPGASPNTQVFSVSLGFERVKIDGVDYFDTAPSHGHAITSPGLGKRGVIVGAEFFDHPSPAIPVGPGRAVWQLGRV